MLFEIEKQSIPATLLKDRFGTNPFSILRADTNEWIKHKRTWEYILKDRENNIRDTISRGNTPYINDFSNRPDFKYAKSPNAGMISTFDPFLCEIMIKWFSNKEDTILDPFAGGIVRGAVSCILGRNYVGYDISSRQVEHNINQWESIEKAYTGIEHAPLYNIGDCEEKLDNAENNAFDMIFTCPPYYNLERYTDEAQDLSNLKTYEEFIDKFGRILKKCYDKIKEGSYCILVVEEIRDKKGMMYGFVADTIKKCQEAGLNYYNEMILMNPIASLGIRSTKYFVESKKVGRHHQNVLVFKK